MLSVVTDDGSPQPGSLIDEIVREGARQILAASLKAEVNQSIAELAAETDERGHRLVVRNGHHRTRTVVTAAGPVEVRAPQVNDRRVDEATGERKRSTSTILAPRCRKSPKVSGRCPWVPNGFFVGSSQPDEGKILMLAHTSVPAKQRDASAKTYEVGDIVWNSAPTPGSALMWRCTTAGTQGTLNGNATTGSIDDGSTTLTVQPETGLAIGQWITAIDQTTAKPLFTNGPKRITKIDGTIDTRIQRGPGVRQAYITGCERLANNVGDHRSEQGRDRWAGVVRRCSSGECGWRPGRALAEGAQGVLAAGGARAGRSRRLLRAGLGQPGRWRSPQRPCRPEQGLGTPRRGLVSHVEPQSQAGIEPADLRGGSGRVVG